MQRYLHLYLIVTGALALLALAAPWLVVLGLILGIIPGIVLGLAPTAFLWGCVFAGSWLASRSLLGDTGVAIAAAGVITAVLMFAVTEPNRAASRAAHKASLLPDVTPPGRLKMAGDIRIDLPWPEWDNENSKGQAGLRGFACDNLCVALLFMPGVASVTINSLKAISDEGSSQWRRRVRQGGANLPAGAEIRMPRRPQARPRLA